VFNVAGGSLTTVKHLLRLVSEQVGRPLITQHLAEQPGDVQATHGTIARTRRLLGWQPEVSLADPAKLQVLHQLGGR
jgi:nucleoside-diphosphate-sugar epimerase